MNSYLAGNTQTGKAVLRDPREEFGIATGVFLRVFVQESPVCTIAKPGAYHAKIALGEWLWD